MNNPVVDSYIKNSPDFAKPILIHLRTLVHKVIPDVEEKIKWGNPHFDYKGPLLYMGSFKAHMIFGFWKQALLKDSQGLFKKDKQAMGSLGRLTDISQLPSDKILTDYIKEAIQLNIEGKKVIVLKHPKPKLVIPDYFKKELTKNKTAEKYFESMPPSHKREYVEWIEVAKTEETRNKRITKTMKMLKESKSMNWEYEKKK